MRLSILPAILLTAFLFWTAVSFARLEPLNGGHVGLIFLWAVASWINHERSSTHARATADTH
jgi:predicted membrane protein